eukprot:1495902-Pyramimonas_sp.AAC.1
MRRKFTTPAPSVITGGCEVVVFPRPTAQQAVGCAAICAPNTVSDDACITYDAFQLPTQPHHQTHVGSRRSVAPTFNKQPLHLQPRLRLQPLYS